MDSYYEESSLSIVIYKENRNKDVLQMLGRKDKRKKGGQGQLTKEDATTMTFPVDLHHLQEAWKLLPSSDSLRIAWPWCVFTTTRCSTGGTCVLGVVIMHSTQNFNMWGAGYDYTTYSKNFVSKLFISITQP